MKTYCNIILWLTIGCLALWIIPWTYNYTLLNYQNVPQIRYSPIANDFAGWKTENGKLKFIDKYGNPLNVTNGDSLFPLYFYRQLINDNRMPDSINGKAITMKDIYQDFVTFKYTPKTHNAIIVPIYLLLESESGRVELEMPTDAFHFTDSGIEFLDMRTNETKEKKSKLFTEMLSKKGFSFPAKKVVGNQTTRKEYDNGFLLVDNKGDLFHLKQMKGRPYVKAITMPEGVTISNMMVCEFKNKRHLGFIFDTDKNMWILHASDYSFHKLEVNYDCTTQYLKIFANMLDWTVSIQDETGESVYAFSNDDYSLLGKHRIDYKEDIFDKIGKFVLPIKLKFSSMQDDEIRPRIESLTN